MSDKNQQPKCETCKGNFRKISSGVAICPFFTWTSEDIGGLGHSEKDVNLVHCIHPNNEDDCEGNCQQRLCPFISCPSCPQPKPRIFKCKHFQEYSQQAPVPFGVGTCSEPLGDCAIESESEDCTLECSDYEESPSCQQLSGDLVKELRNVIERYEVGLKDESGLLDLSKQAIVRIEGDQDYLEGGAKKQIKLIEKLAIANAKNKQAAPRILALEGANRWIPVSERLPEVGKDGLAPCVLVIDAGCPKNWGKGCYVNYHRGNDGFWTSADNIGEPTHWKPIVLPDALGEKGKE